MRYHSTSKNYEMIVVIDLLHVDDLLLTMKVPTRCYYISPSEKKRKKEKGKFNGSAGSRDDTRIDIYDVRRSVVGN